MAATREETILIVDDVPENIRLLAGALSSRGYQVRAFPSGELALRAVQNLTPDLVLLDINMPGMDGYEVCAALKAIPAVRDVPVLFISASQDTESKLKAFEHGGLDYVSKPFRLEEVFARVETHLELHGLRKRLTGQNDQLTETLGQVQQLNAQLEAQQVSLEQVNTRLEASVRHGIETNQAMLEHMVAVNGLNRLAAHFAAESSREGLLDATAREIRNVVGSQMTVLDLVESGSYGFQNYLMHPTDGAISTGRKKFDPESLVYEVLQKGEALLCNDVGAADDPRWQTLAGSSHRSILVAPVTASNAPIGVITLLAQYPDHFDERIRPICEQLASMLGTNLVLRQAIDTLRDSLETADNILVNMFPAPVAGRIKSGEHDIAEKIECAGVFFSDLAGFTAYASQVDPDTTLGLLKAYFGALEKLCEEHRVEKIKTIGDAFMAISGVSVAVEDPIKAIAEFALAASASLAQLLAGLDAPLNHRIGIHAGPLISGVLGKSRVSFDVWGDTVNMASRLESHAPVGEIACSQVIYEHLKSDFAIEKKGSVMMKGKGEQPLWILQGSRKD